MNNKRVLFYAAVPDVRLFEITGFYQTDIRILKELGCEVITTNSYLDFFRFWTYDYSFIYFFTSGVFPAIISKVFGKKVFITGGVDPLDQDYNNSTKTYIIQKALFKLCYLFSNNSIIVSESDLNNVKKIIKNHNKLFYLPHVIDIDSYEYKGESKENVITTIVWMQFIGNVLRKGVDKLVYVFHEFLKLHPNFKLLIIGTKGEGTVYLQNIIDKLDLNANVFFLGSVSEEEKIAYLKNSKYYFQLSKFEGFGIGALEALAAGNIVFHSGKGGLKYTMKNFGILIERTDKYSEIARIIDMVEQEYEVRKNFIDQSIDFIKRNYSYNIRLNGIKQVMGF